jgi:Na+-driven multidrug efflux pump
MILGVLVLVWLFVGYFEFFDFGIGKATANQMSRLRDAPISAREEVFWTGALINGMLGLLGGLVLLAAGHYGTNAYFDHKLSGELDDEIRMALPWLALAVPIGTVSAVGVAALEAREVPHPQHAAGTGNRVDPAPAFAGGVVAGSGA